MQITISAPGAPEGQYFGRIDLKQTNGTRKLHLPVAFFRRQGDVTADADVRAGTIVAADRPLDCTVSVHNPTLTAGRRQPRQRRTSTNIEGAGRNQAEVTARAR